MRLRTTAAVVVAALLLAALFVVASQSLAVAEPASDTDPPHVVTFDYGPKTVNTALSGQLVTFTIHLTDDLSGVTDHLGPTQARFQSPSDGQLVDVTFRPMYDLVSGDALDGIYVNEFTLPRYCETGTWRLKYFLLYDDAGNHAALYQADMDALGFPTELLVTDTIHLGYLPIVRKGMTP